MGRLTNMLISVENIIIVELSTLNKDKYLIDPEDEFDFEFLDRDNEWYAITSIYKKNSDWYMGYDGDSYEINFHSIDIGLQCRLLDYINEKYESD